MPKISLNFNCPRGIHFEHDDGRVGVVTTLIDELGNITQDPAEACQIVVFIEEGYWLNVAVEPHPLNRTAMSAGSA